MENKNVPEFTPTPSVIQAIASGFNLTASNIYLIVLPVLLDLLLLFGPRIRIYDLYHSSFAEAFTQMQSSIPSGYAAQFQQAYTLIQNVLEQINLLGALETIPIGVYSLLAGSTPMKAPIQGIQVIEAGSTLQVIALVGLFSVIGLLAGCFYFAVTANKTAVTPFHLTNHAYWRQVLNVVLMCIGIVAVLCLVMIPASCAMTMFSLISPILGQIISILLFLAVAWMIIPLFFTVHGVFLHNLDISKAVSGSFSMARWSSGQTSFFIVALVVISQGLNLIWSIPKADSWLILISILGHAFISTGLLAASFILYQKNEEWQSNNKEFIEWRKSLAKRSRFRL